MEKNESLCLSCAERKACPMNEALEIWEEVAEEYKDQVMPEYVFEEHYIDAPDISEGKVVWCPLYLKEK